MIIFIIIYLIIGFIVLIIHEWASGIQSSLFGEPLDPLSFETKFIIVVAWLPLLIKNIKDR